MLCLSMAALAEIMVLLRLAIVSCSEIRVASRAHELSMPFIALAAVVIETTKA